MGMLDCRRNDGSSIGTFVLLWGISFDIPFFILSEKIKMTTQTKPTIEVKLGFKWQGLLLAILVGLAIWFCPTPEGLTPKAWSMLALFVATIVAIIAKAMPMGAATLVALVVSGLTGLTPLSAKQGEVGMLSGFANGTIWLIGIAMSLSRAVIKTGLGKRIALYFVARFGKKMMGVAYGMALADVVIGPGIPSASARGGDYVPDYAVYCRCV